MSRVSLEKLLFFCTCQPSFGWAEWQSSEPCQWCHKSAKLNPASTPRLGSVKDSRHPDIDIFGSPLHIQRAQKLKPREKLTVLGQLPDLVITRGFRMRSFRVFEEVRYLLKVYLNRDDHMSDISFGPQSPICHELCWLIWHRISRVAVKVHLHASDAPVQHFWWVVCEKY